MTAAFQLPEPLPDEVQQIINSSVARFGAYLRSKLGPLGIALAGDKITEWVAEYRQEAETVARKSYEAAEKLLPEDRTIPIP